VSEHAYMYPHLSTADDIAALLQERIPPAPGPSSPPTRGARGVAQLRQDFEPRAVGRKPRERCKCGSCHTCQENAKWDRIFSEKFADPDYYADRTPTMGSSLSSI
jgi:hypothetical protein